MPSELLRFAVVSTALTDDPRQAARLARGAGFDGLLFDAFSGLSLPDLSATGRRDFKHMLTAQDQELAGLRVDIGARGIAPGADVDRVLARLERVMDASAALSSRLLCVDLGPLPAPPRQPKPAPAITPLQTGLIIIPAGAPASSPAASVLDAISEPPDTAAMAQVDGVLIELGRRADRYGVALALRSELASFAALERALKSAGCPWFGVDLDPVSILRDEWELDEIFSRLGPLIRHVRGRDALRGADRRTKPAVIGQGSTNWPELLSALDSAGYHGWITLDPMELPNRTAAAIEGLEHLRS